MKRIIRIIISLLVGFCFWITSIGFTLVLWKNNQLTIIYFITLFLLFLDILGITALKKKDMRTENSKKLVKFFWAIFIFSLIFLFYTGVMYFTYYFSAYQYTYHFVEVVGNFLIPFFYTFFKIFLFVISILLGFFFYYLLSPTKNNT